MEEILYIKTSDYRDAKYNLKTEIVTIDGQKFVRKIPVTIEAQKHIENICRYEQNLKKIFEPEVSVSEIKSIKEENNRGLLFEYVKGKSLETLLSEATYKDNDSILNIIEKYHDLVFKMKTGTGCVVGDDFRKVFGIQQFDPDIEVGDFVDVDLILSNIIVNTKPHIIDYEWCMDFAVPLKYIFWKGLFTSLAFSKLTYDFKEEVFVKYGISDELQKTFLNMEEHFVEHAKGKSITFGKQANKIFPSVVGINNIIWDGMNYPVTFWGKKNGDVRQFGPRVQSYAGYNCFNVDIDGDYDRIEVFIAPVASIISKINVKGYKNGVEENISFTTTSEVDEMDIKFFLKNTPVIFIDNDKYDSFQISFVVNVWNANELTEPTIDNYLNGINYVCENGKIELQQKKDILKELKQKSFFRALIFLLKYRKKNR